MKEWKKCDIEESDFILFFALADHFNTVIQSILLLALVQSSANMKALDLVSITS